MAAPTLSLPKGGGAIHGIGEKFASNPVTGTGSFSVPIHASPGRGGFSPQIVLSYDSGNGNGPVGYGWHLGGVSAITRKTDKGLPRYDDATDSDVFVLAGAEDIVPELAENAGQWSRVEALRPLYGRQYRVRCYRPRIESQFDRLERWTNTIDASDVFWRALSRDNVTTWYGHSSESRITDPADTSRIFSWLECETHDDRGNVSVYRYLAEDSTRVAVGSAHERNRTNQTRSANRYLDRIQYGNRVPYYPDLTGDAPIALPADWCFEVVFDYGNHVKDVPLPVEAGVLWPCRDDPFSSYRPGFEVRTYRLCRRVLMFHHFPVELDPAVGPNCLVRSTDFTYSQDIDPADPANPVYSFLTRVTQTGYRRAGAGYASRSLPPVEFGYTAARIDDTLQEGDSGILENLPQGLDGIRFQWVDLDGGGVPGILTEQSGAWYFKKNLSPAGGAPGAPPPSLRFAELECLGPTPSLAALGRSKQQLLDLAGEGQVDLVDFSAPIPGFFERSDQFSTPGWEPFHPFDELPVLDWSNLNLKFIDLNGDGHADILISENDAFVWHASLAEAGFGPARRALKALDEERGPRVIFADGTESVFLADMSGDGLTDIVRVRRGEVCFWPNRGHGRFGTKVTMENAPLFEPVDVFDGQRLRLTDIDGSGTSDLVYFSNRGTQLYFNQSGNGWSELNLLPSFPEADRATSVVPLDLLGTGTTCLVWSSALPGAARRPLRYVNLMSDGKPHLLTSLINNLGAETSVEYAPSARFYVADELAGRPWITRLPFPVHVVARVATYDHVSRNRFVSRYAYHHGYFDGVEREFRGFGMVEQWDTEEIASVVASGVPPPATNLDAASYVPPVLTRTWYHTGVDLGRERVSDYFSGDLYPGDPGEYYRPPGLTPAELDALLLDDTPLPPGLTADEEREACRALKGSILRQEMYALDGSDRARHPYVVTEQNFSVVRLQPHQDGQFGVFMTHARESRSFNYERNPTEPRISHTLTLEVDRYGNVLRSLAVAYGRRGADPDLEQQDQDCQAATWITYTETDVTNAVDPEDARRNPLVSEVRAFEVTGFAPAGFLSWDTWTAGNCALPRGLPTIAYEAVPDPHLQQKRLIDCVTTRYRRNDLTALLGKDVLESQGLAGEAYRLAVTPGMLANVFQRQLGGGPVENLIPDPTTTLGGADGDQGGYVDFAGDGRWWIPSGRTFLSLAADPAHPAATAGAELAEARAHFYVGRQIVDPFGEITVVGYDNDDLTVARTVDAAGNATAAAYDYRVLAPRTVTDPNLNRSEACFDLLGMLAGTARRGKVGENVGDVLTGFDADLPQAAIDVFFGAGDPTAAAVTALVDASTRVIYDVDRFWRTRQANPSDPTKWLPVCAAAVARETHFFDLPAGRDTAVQLLFAYSDGMGREIQKKARVEPGPLVDGGPICDPRWVCSGWTIFNNKGHPVRQFEPLFSATHEYEFAPEAGVSPVLFYDPLNRVFATLHPDHSWEKVAFDAWRHEAWDPGDTVAIIDPKTDPDVGSCFARLPDAWYLPTWYSVRMAGGLGADAKAAAVKSATYAGTPTRTYADALGRTRVTIAHNRYQLTGSPLVDELHRSRVDLDVQGRTLKALDARGIPVASFGYDMVANRILQVGADSGTRWILNDVAGKRIRTWDDRGQAFRNKYDALRRPTASYVVTAGGGPFLVIETLYGETRLNAEADNLRTRVLELHDQAGAYVSDRYDFKGNLLHSTRQLAQNFQDDLDWSAGVALAGPVYEHRTAYDALDRPTELQLPDASRVHPFYSLAGRLQRLEANLRGAAASTVFVSDIMYTAKGQRRQIDYGNGASTEYLYDPETFRMVQLTTSRPAVAPDLPVVQDLSWIYDVAGNISRLRDDAQQTIFFRNRRVDPTTDYLYDATNRLIEALGREHLGLASGAPQSADPYDAFNVGLAQPGDGNALGTYREQYSLDPAGNILATRHQGLGPASPGWRRCYQYALDSNRLLATTNPALPHDPNVACATPYAVAPTYTDTYDYDAHGNMTRMPHLPVMRWDYHDQLSATTRQVTVDVAPETTYYRYDASGKRVRKVTVLATGAIKDDRVYLQGLEVYELGGVNPLRRETLHIMDDLQRIALVETRTDAAPTEQLVRYQFGNHLGSATLELDDGGEILSYEEYTPYGSTTYQAVRSSTQTLKRYRFTSAERDEESGLGYHSARYLAPWLGRWTAADSVGIAGGGNLYAYCRCNPVTRVDPSGHGDGPSFAAGITIDSNGIRLGAFATGPPVTDAELNFTATGPLRRVEMGTHVDEIVAVKGEKAGGVAGSPSDIANKQFLDQRTNPQTKSNFVSNAPSNPRPPVSAAKSPQEAGNRLLTAPFSEVEEMKALGDDATARTGPGLRTNAVLRANMKADPAIRGALSAVGVNPDTLKPENPPGVDQFPKSGTVNLSPKDADVDAATGRVVPGPNTTAAQQRRAANLAAKPAASSSSTSSSSAGRNSTALSTLRSGTASLAGGIGRMVPGVAEAEIGLTGAAVLASTHAPALVTPLLTAAEALPVVAGAGVIGAGVGHVARAGAIYAGASESTANGIGLGAAVLTGAAIGSVIPGVGTAVGAGIGALVAGGLYLWSL